MTDEEKNEVLDELIKKMKSIPQLATFYDISTITMPGIMEAILKETFDTFIFNKKITNEEIIKRCENLLLKFYDYYNIAWEGLVDEHGNHIYDETIKDLDYLSIWKVIKLAQNDEIKQLDESNFIRLNELHKKYKEK